MNTSDVVPRLRNFGGWIGSNVTACLFVYASCGNQHLYFCKLFSGDDNFGDETIIKNVRLIFTYGTYGNIAIFFLCNNSWTTFEQSAEILNRIIQT